MANSDYTINGSGAYAARATVASGVGALDTAIFIENFRSNGLVPEVGDPLYCDGEFMRLVEVSGAKLTVARGCIDTLPHAIAQGASLWFIRSAIGRNNLTYASGEEIGVKPLPRTTSKPHVTVADAPPARLGFIGRFERPYPPGNVKVNGLAWYLTHSLSDTESLAVTWAHRDRVVQADQLVGHDEASVGPEAGVTYTLDVYHEALLAPVASHSGIADAGFTYTAAHAKEDFGIEPGEAADFAGTLVLRTFRGEIEARATYTIPFNIVIQPYGLGMRLGESLGGVLAP